MEWRSPAGAEVGGRIVLFPDRGSFFVRLRGFDFPGPQVNPLGVAFEVRRALGAAEAKWRTDGKGVFRYP
jgi:hypothetical protein